MTDSTPTSPGDDEREALIEAIAVSNLDHDVRRRLYTVLVRRLSPLTQEALAESVFQALGEVAVCWSGYPSLGVFDATRARQIGDELVAKIASQPVQVEVTDEMIERGLKVSREFPMKRGLDNAYNVMRAVLEAALGGGDQ